MNDFCIHHSEERVNEVHKYSHGLRFSEFEKGKLNWLNNQGTLSNSYIIVDQRFNEKLNYCLQPNSTILKLQSKNRYTIVHTLP